MIPDVDHLSIFLKNGTRNAVRNFRFHVAAALVADGELVMNEMPIMPRVLILSPAANIRKEASFDHEMIDALEQAGFRLSLCTEMDEALSILGEDDNYIVLIDHNEDGEVDRFMSTSGIRAKFRGGIVLFVGPSSRDRRRGLNGGADVVISPPKRAAELIAYLYSLHRRVTILSAMSEPAAT
jgi:CheY-like chemotaxis protein